MKKLIDLSNGAFEVLTRDALSKIQGGVGYCAPGAPLGQWACYKDGYYAAYYYGCCQSAHEGGCQSTCGPDCYATCSY